MARVRASKTTYNRMRDLLGVNFDKSELIQGAPFKRRRWPAIRRDVYRQKWHLLTNCEPSQNACNELTAAD